MINCYFNFLGFTVFKLFAKYTSVGILNTLIHWVVFACCIYILGTNQALVESLKNDSSSFISMNDLYSIYRAGSSVIVQLGK